MSRLIEDYLRSLFDEKRVLEQHREELWQYYYDKLSKGVDVGFSPKSLHYDKDLANALKYSIAEFSAFKETSFRKVLESLLIDENGGLRSWRDFKKEAYKVSGDYNHRWLETEYHQTIANANMAEKWKGFEANADLYPNLKLVSVRDGRVRPEHKILDGTIRPISDPFWKTHTPPLDWGCRCDVVQTDEDPTDIKGGLQLKMEFENNPALTGKIFGGSAYEKTLTKEEVNNIKKEIKDKLTLPVEYKKASMQELETMYKKQNINVKNEEIIMNDGYVATANSFSINSQLRRGLKDEMFESQKSVVDALDSLIKSNKLNDNYILYRNDGFGFVEHHFGLDISNMSNKEAIKAMKSIGKSEISDKGFYSASAIKEENFFMNRKIHSEVKVKKGTNAFITSNFEESEIILGRNQKFRILDILEEDDKIKIITETID